MASNDRPIRKATEGSSVGEVNNPRLRQLDGVRGVAILLVLFGHAGGHDGLQSFAAAGVTLFFVLSAFLITKILLKEHHERGRINLPAFYARRMTRLAPPLFFMLMITGLLMAPGWLAWLSAATWTGNYAFVLGWQLGPYTHTWSLAVEEQFYLLWPLLLLGLMRCRRAVACAMCLLVLLVSWRLNRYAAGEVLYAYGALETAGSAIIAGCIVALARLRLSRAWGSASMVLLLAVAIVSSLAGVGWWVVVPFLTTPAAALFVAAAQSLRWLSWRPLNFAGLASYSIYLWHEPVSYFIDDSLSWTGVAAGAATGLAAYFIVEEPVMRRRARQQQVAADPPLEFVSAGRP